jgi:hypothetical protein
MVMACLSFAHLKKKPAGEIQDEKMVVTLSRPPVSSPTRTTYRIPAVMPTALLHATNYCRGCPRYLSASERDKSNLGIIYGQCLRTTKKEIKNESGEVEVVYVDEWKNIPTEATVGRCWFFVYGG